MRAALAKADIGSGVVVDLAEPTRIEKADDRRLAGKIEHSRGLRAGAKAAADLGIASLRQLTDDRGLAALHLAKQPNHGSKAACPLRNRLLNIGGGAHRGQDDRAPRRNKQGFLALQLRPRKLPPRSAALRASKARAALFDNAAALYPPGSLQNLCGVLRVGCQSHGGRET